MASKKEEGGFGTLLAVIAIVAALGTWMVISPGYLMKALTAEREFSSQLGGHAADQWIYSKMLSTSIGQVKGIASSIKETKTMPSMLKNWAQERIITTWLWGSLIIYRANMLVLYWFILMPFTIAATTDGFWVREISTFRFSSQSPIRHRFGVLISTMTLVSVCVWVVLPIPIPSVVAPLAIVAIGFATWMWLSNMQKRI